MPLQYALIDSKNIVVMLVWNSGEPFPPGYTAIQTDDESVWRKYWDGKKFVDPV